jgi:hypothetical protein
MSRTRCKILFSLNLNNSLVCFIHWKQKSRFISVTQNLVFQLTNRMCSAMILWRKIVTVKIAGNFSGKVLKLRSFVSTRDIIQKIEAVKYNYFEKSCLLEYNVVYYGESPQPFRRNTKPQFSRSKSMRSKKMERRVSKHRRAPCRFLASFIIRPWRWSRHISPNRLSTLSGQLSDIFQKKNFFITTAVITANPTHLLCSPCVFLSIVWAHTEKLIFAQLDNFAAFYSAHEVHYCGRNNLPRATQFYFHPQ